MLLRKAVLSAAVALAAAFMAWPQAGISRNTKILNLNEEIPDWRSVIGGNAVAPAVETSYGIAVLSDGRMLSSCTSQGNVIWKKGVGGKPSKWLAIHRDFIYVVTNDRKLTLINQSGLQLWTASCPFRITESPLAGHDGRVFVRGESAVACFGINGSRKWQVSTKPLSPVPMCMMNDGSVVVFLDSGGGGQTVGKRISPYGEELEDLIFTSVVESAVGCEKGIVVALRDGSMGLCNVVGGEAKSPWVQNSFIGSGAFAVCYSERTGNTAFMFATGGGTTVVMLRTDTGEFLNQFQVGRIAGKDLKLARTTKSGFFVADSQNAMEFAEDGSVYWTARLPDSTRWNFLHYTDSNHLILCMNDWELRSYHTMQTAHSVYKDFYSDTYTNDEGERVAPPDTPETAMSVQNLKETDRTLGIRMFSNDKIEEIQKKLRKGDYGALEKDYLGRLKSELRNYEATFQTAQPEQSFFAKNPVYTRIVLEMAAQIGCADFSSDFALLLRRERDPIQISSILYAAGKQLYDPDGEMLTAFESVIRTPLVRSSPGLLKNLCDATFSICRFMGRPALSRHGKEILRELYSKDFPSDVREYASNTLRKFAEVDM